MSLKIGISGKRAILETEKNFVAGAIENQIAQILQKHNTTSFIGYTSLAIGADTIFAEVVTGIFNQPLQVILPFDKNTYLKDFSEWKQQEKYLQLLGMAKRVHIATNQPPDNELENAIAYFEAGKQVVDACDEMLFVWDELKPAGIGGTAEIIGYHSEKKRINEVPYIAVLGKKEDEIFDEIDHQYALLNEHSIKSKKKYTLMWQSLIWLGLLAATFLSANSSLQLKGLLELGCVCAELLVVVIVWGLILYAKKHDFHGKYVAQRLRAETFRVMRQFYAANIEVKITPHTVDDDKTIIAVVKKINDCIKKENYKSMWFANYTIKALIADQRKYHEKKVEGIGKKAHLFEKMIQVVALLFLMVLISHFVSVLLEYFLDRHLPNSFEIATRFLSIILPPVYAALEGYLHFQEWELLKKYSKLVLKSLVQAQEILPHVGTVDEAICFARQSEALNIIGNAMLADNKNWNLVFQNKNNYNFIV